MADLLERLKAALADRYTIERELGSGGMATVYLAEDLKHHRKVAIKVLRPELSASLFAERFLREIEITANLNHPHILPLLDSGEADGFLFYVMPCVEGESLRDRLNREKQLPVDDAVKIASEVADALNYAHAHNVIHRDVKPENIMLEAGHAIVADFGIARAVTEAGGEKLTETGIAVGTPSYLSPEQASGESDLDGRSDVYSLGCVLHEMLAGEPPFTGPTAENVIRKHISAEPTPVSVIRPVVPGNVSNVVQRALAKTRVDRFASAEEFAKALVKRTPVPGWQTSVRRRWRWAPVWLGAAVLSVAILVGVLLLGSASEVAFDERDWILIADIENLTGDSIFDRSLDMALTVALQQSRHANVFSRTRIAETLRRMRREDVATIDEAIGREIAQRENLRVLIVPSIARLDTVFVLTTRVVDPLTGETLKSRSARAPGIVGVLPALDELARELRRDLGETRWSVARRGVRLGQATTPSLEALRAWSEGRQHWSQRRYDEAMTLFRRAIELDSNFAMAHQGLGAAYYWSNDRANGELHFSKALALTDRVTERERLWIQAEMNSWRNHIDAAIDAYNIYLTRYPDDIGAWSRVGYVCMRSSRFDEAVSAFERVLELDSLDAATYINLATSLSAKGQSAEAVVQYQRAFALRPEWLVSGNLNHEFGFTLVQAGELDSAEQVFTRMLNESLENQALGHRSLALLRMYTGRYTEAREHLHTSVSLFNEESSVLSELRSRLYLAAAYRANGSDNAFREQLTKVRELADSPSVEPAWLAFVGKAHARSGLVEEAEQILAHAVARMDEDSRVDRAAVNLLRGELALTRDSISDAISHFQTAYALNEDDCYLESLAHSHLVAAHLGAAESDYAALIAVPDLGWEAQEPWVLAHYWLGRICEEKGDTVAAMEYYGRLLDIWRTGDEDLIALLDARRRLVALSDLEVTRH